MEWAFFSITSSPEWESRVFERFWQDCAETRKKDRLVLSRKSMSKKEEPFLAEELLVEAPGLSLRY